MVVKIALTAQKGRGKDTFYEMAREIVPDLERVGFADALKDEFAEDTHVIFCRKHSVMNEFHDRIIRLVEDRTLMATGWQWYGEFCRQLYGDNYWINKFEQDMPDGNFVIADVRHPNEAEWCLQNGIYLIRIEGPDHRADDGRDTSHPSERHVPTLPVNKVIYNDGTLDYFRQQVHEIVGRRV